MLDLTEGIKTYLDSGARNGTTYWLLACAEGNLKNGDLASAEALVEEAFSFAQSHGERTLQADAHRLKAEILLCARPADVAGALAEFDRAIEISRACASKSLELRATMALARCLSAQGREFEAHAMLAEIFSWFSEGFESGDLRAARQLLEEFGSRSPAAATEARWLPRPVPSE